MFATRLHSLGGDLLAVAADIEPDLMTAAQAAEVIKEAAEIERTAAGVRLRCGHRIDNESLWGEDGERSAAEWMGRQTGQSAADAARDLECSRRLKELPAADDAVKKGELSPDQAKAIADAASEDPGCEDELLDTAKRGSFGELARKAKARKAAALGDDEARHKAAHKNRSFKKGTNAAGEGWGRFNGPADMNARLNARLKPFLDDVFAQARKAGRRERTDAYQYDALMAALGLTDTTAGSGSTSSADDGDLSNGDDTGWPAPNGGPTPPTPGPAPMPAPRSPGREAKLIMRVDAAALKRGHTVAGELCEIDGLGPVPVAAIREFLPGAAIVVVITNGVDVFNVTNFARRANALQQIVLDLLNIGCTRLGCAATEHLEVDHRAEWHKIKVTELENLDWLCAHDHRLKTHDGWQLEPGTGKRAMRPPGQQTWLTECTEPPDHASVSPRARPPPRPRIGRSEPPRGSSLRPPHRSPPHRSNRSSAPCAFHLAPPPCVPALTATATPGSSVWTSSGVTFHPGSQVRRPPRRLGRATTGTDDDPPRPRVGQSPCLRSIQGVTNRLADETSPYLRQHRDNPVDWYPWGDEAFARAVAEDRPILLSVGYSACHWCHVMAHESFEDPATAAVMNDLFVNVKVDREERPDVDAVYMDAVQSLTGQGGWPMTVFLTPDGRPFFGGTYFPNEARQGMPAFTDLCRAVAEHWRDQRDELLENADKLTQAIGRSSEIVAAGDLPPRELLHTAYDQLREHHDPEWGGFGRSPKFPQTMSLELLLRTHAHQGAPEPLAVVSTSLDAMASGGIYDHLGGGFSRYSVDTFWMVPHFEKMLYDQALLARVYLHAWQVTGEARFCQVLEETVEYVRRDLRDTAGGFYSAEDADSEGEEGKFYVWRAEEIEAVLDAETAAAVIDWYGVTRNGNFEGSNILHRPVRGDLARPAVVERGRVALLAARTERVRPGLDDKVLTEWNALMLATLAEAAAATGNDEWLADAVRNAEFLVDHLRRDDGRWLRAWQSGDADHPARAQHLAYAADHAALVDAFTRLAEATGASRWIAEARAAADALLDLFWDDEAGGLFTTGSDAEALIARQKDFQDNAAPSANSLAAQALLRLAALTGEDRYLDAATAILRLFGPLAGRYANAFAHLLGALDLLTTGPAEIVVVGDRPDLVATAAGRYLPNAVLAWGEPYESPLWEGRADDAAYLCRDFACQLPATTTEAFAAQLDALTTPTN